MIPSWAVSAGSTCPDEQESTRAAEDHYIRFLGSVGRFSEIATPLAQMVGGVEDIPVLVPEELRGEFIPSTPSVHFDGSRRRAIMRGVNYRQTADQRTLFDGGDEKCRSRNWWVEFDAAWKVERVSIMDAPDADRPGAVQGFEDCRLFHSGGSYWASCSFAERPRLIGDSPMGLLCEMAVLKLTDDGKISEVSALRGPWSVYHQKNWKPAPTDSEPLRWIYSSDPLITVAPAMSSAPHRPKWYCASPWRGGSQAVRLGSRWLWVDHRPILSFDGPRNIYLHRFVLADAALSRIDAVSAPFVFRGFGVEFCAGLAIDGDRLVLSYSARDAFPFLAVCNLEAVIKTLHREID